MGLDLDPGLWFRVQVLNHCWWRPGGRGGNCTKLGRNLKLCAR